MNDAKKKGDLPLNLLQLQNLIKRDPSCYDEEFMQQLQHFDSSLEIFRLNPSAEADEFGDLISFLSHVTSVFPNEGKQFPDQVLSLLEDHADVMSPTLRRHLCKSVMLLRSKDQVPSVRVYELFFKLFRCPDKQLRDTLHSYIVTDIKKVNLKKHNQRLNKALQNFMFTMMKDANVKAAHKSLQVMTDLYKKGAWRDEKTVNVIVSACFSPHTKVKVGAMKFFLGVDDELDNDDDDVDENEKLIRDVKMSLKVGKTTTKKKRNITKAVASVNKAKRKENAKVHFDFSALHLINDAQGTAEKLFTDLRKTNHRFEVRLIMMNLISRLVGVHELILLNFYPFLQKYLQPKQNEVTSILTYLSQACHPLVPSDTLEPVMLTLVNNFVSDRCSSEVITVGLNTVRTICSRCPLAMNETLLQDLTQYKKFKDKGVTIAARALIQLFREINPSLLSKADRGKDASEGLKDFTPLEYGATKINDYIPGTELLTDDEDEEEELDEDGAPVKRTKQEADEDDGWESQDEESSEGEWVDIQHSGDEGAEKEPAMTEEERDALKEKAIRISRTRILTPADFAKIQRRMAENAYMGKEKNKRRKISTDTDGVTRNTDRIIDVVDIERTYKKAKMDKEARMASIESGRDDRQKFGSRKADTRTGGLTNAAKAKTKNFQMMLKSDKVRTKQRESSLDRKQHQRKAARKQKKRIR